MPYIPMDRRPVIDMGEVPQNAGELNYRFTTIILRNADDPPDQLIRKLVGEARKYLDAEPLRYQRINDVIGALRCCRYEIERRVRRDSRHTRFILLTTVERQIYSDVAAPYEDKAIVKNGDIAYG